MENLKLLLCDSTFVKLTIIFIVADTIFGILRSLKEKKLNSSVGIDGIIRKSAMLFSILFFALTDLVMQFNFIAFLPTEAIEYLRFDTIGTVDFFAMLFFCFEVLSVLKNLYKLGVPMPYKLRGILETLLTKVTEEVKGE